MTYSRREFGKMALGSITVASAVLSNPSLFAADKPDSKFGGVQIGIIIPYSYHNMPSDGPWLLNAMVRDGINLCESHSEPIEQWAGSPMPAAAAELREVQGEVRLPRKQEARPQPVDTVLLEAWPCAAHSRASRGPEGCSRRNDEMASVGSDEQVCRVPQDVQRCGCNHLRFQAEHHNEHARRRM